VSTFETLLEQLSSLGKKDARRAARAIKERLEELDDIAAHDEAKLSAKEVYRCHSY
jgi:hypothetical protein